MNPSDEFWKLLLKRYYKEEAIHETFFPREKKIATVETLEERLTEQDIKFLKDNGIGLE